MSNEKFKVKFGLAVGDTAATIDAATGNIVTNGDIQLGGGDIKASDGTTAITVAPSTGNVTVAGDLTVTGGDITKGTTNGFITISQVTSATSVPQNGLRIKTESLGTPAVGFGNNLEFAIETAPSVITQSGVVQVEITDITPGAESFKMDFALTSAGSSQTRMELDHLGNLALDGGIKVSGSTNGSSTFNAPATGSTLVYTLPGSQGAANTALTNDGSGNLTWVLPGGGGSTFGNITIAVADDNTISTTTGDLKLHSATGVVKTVGDLTIGGNDIKASDGTTALSLTTSSGNVTVAGDLTVTGTNITSGATDTGIIVDMTASGTAGLQLPLSVRSTSTGTPAVGFGPALNFIGQTTTSNFENAGFVGVRATGIGAGTEDFRMTFGLMQNGAAAATKMELSSAGDLQIDGDLTVSGTNINTGVTNNIIQIDRTSTATNSAPRALILKSTTSATPAIGMGTSLEFIGQTDASNFEQAGFISVNATDITAASEDFSMNFGLMTAGAAYATKLTIDSLGNLTPVGNFVKGVIRNATTEANSDVWSFSSGAGTGYRGISIDNSTNTAKAPATVLRSFTGGAVAGNATTPAVLFERARGTSASPTAVQSGDFLGRLLATGANGANTFITDTVAASPAALTFFAAENFVSNTNVGTQMSVALMPTGKTLASVATPTVVLNITPQTTISRSDNFTWQNGNTIANANQNTKMSLDNIGILTLQASNATTTLLAGDVNIMQAASTWQSALTPGFKYTGLMSSSTQTASGSTFEMSSRWKAASADVAFVPPVSGWGLGKFSFSADNSTTGTSQQNAGAIQSIATENWDSTHYGSKLVFVAQKLGTGGPANVLSMSPETTNLTSDVITLESSAGTDYAVLSANTAKFNVPVTTEITTTTISEGTTYTPAATVDNNISVQINTLAGGTTVIDLINLTGNSRGASYNILVFNNTASGTPIQVKNTRISSGNLMTHTITTGSPRIIINAFVVGDYATATHFVVA